MLSWLNKSKFHFIGIGGIGMSGIAEILLDLGCTVSGSDLHENELTNNLKIKGAKIFSTHQSQNINEDQVVIYSSAISKNNPEILKARELKLRLIQRADMLAELMRFKSGIAIAGSHGKTTTSSLVATIFNTAKMNATHIVGGIISNLGGNARNGSGNYFIAEADESDGSFLKLSPSMAVITNIDSDHLDYYGTSEKVVEAFVKFVNNLPFYGKAFLNINDNASVNIKESIDRTTIWYGIEDTRAEYEARDLFFSGTGSEFNLFFKNTFIQKIKTHLLGRHNVSNTLAAIALSHEAEISFDLIQKGLLEFKGVGRRLEKLFEKDGFLILDDYGHHPTEIEATLSTLKSIDERPLVVLFEPHRFTRTKTFWNEFKNSFRTVSELYFLPIYAASEDAIVGITSAKMVEELLSEGVNAKMIEVSELKNLIESKKNKNCIVLSLGAGAISNSVKNVVKDL